VEKASSHPFGKSFVKFFGVESHESTRRGVSFQVLFGAGRLLLGCAILALLAGLSSQAAFAASTTGQMTSPAQGSTLPGATVTFTWSAGTSATAYWLYLGTTGSESANVYNSGGITGTSITVTGIPTYGVTLYATLFSKINGAWVPVSYTYTEAGSPVLAAMTSPTPGSTLSGSSITFTWSAGGGPTAYYLYIGTTGAQSANIYNSGTLYATSVTVSSVPTYGVTLYVTLFSKINGAWEPASYTYTEGGSPVLAAMSSPTPGGTFFNSSVNFTWTAGGGPTAYWLYIGTEGVGSANLYDSGGLHGTSVSVTGLPTSGATVYVTLFSQINGAWQPVHYVYTEASPPAQSTITSPASGATLSGSSVTFSWTAGSQVSAYWLYVGTTGARSTNILNSGSISSTSLTVSSIPTSGVDLYVTLFSEINGTWEPESYVYIEAGTTTLAAITSPVPGATLPGASVSFSWSTGSGPTAYWLYVGTQGQGSANLYNSGSILGLTLSLTVNSLPTNGSTIYVTLYSFVDLTWKPVYYTYTAASGSYQVNLSWDAPAPVTGITISGYNVYRAVSGSTTYVQINPTLDTTTSYQDTSVSDGVTYDYYVESVDSEQVSSGPSTIFSATIP
jgi:serine protease